MGIYWALIPISLLAVGFLGVLVYERLLGKRAPAFVSLLPTLLALLTMSYLYFISRHDPLTVTLFAWDGTGAFTIALAYHVDAWAALLAGLALFLGLCAQVLIAVGGITAGNVAAGSERTGQNWDHAALLAGLALVLNLAFSANMEILYMSWCALGLLVFVSLQAISQRERREDRAMGVVGDGLQTESEDADVEGRLAIERMAVLKYLAAYGLLGSVLLLASAGENLSFPLGLRGVELSLAPAAFFALALSAYLGLYPFSFWRSRVGPSASTVAIPLGVLPVLAAFYVLGRLYPLAIERTSPTVWTMLCFLAVATMLVSSARLWMARDLSALLNNAIAIEIGFAVVALGLADLRTFPAAILIFLNGVLVTQAVSLSSALVQAVNLPLARSGADGESGGAVSPTRPGISLQFGRVFLLAPWLSLIGLPFTLGFLAKWMLFAASPDVRLIALWPVAAVTNGVVLVASLRLLDRRLFGYDAVPVSGAGGAGVTGQGDARGKRGAQTVLTIASTLPWVISLVIGLLPNQTLQWLVVPTAGAILGEEFARLYAARVAFSDGLIAGVALVPMLFVVILAVYAYPLPRARLAIAGLRGRAASAAASSETSTVSLRSVFLETIFETIAIIVARWSAPDGTIKRMSRWLERAGGGLARLNDAVQESYFYPALAVCGFIVILVFLG